MLKLDDILQLHWKDSVFKGLDKCLKDIKHPCLLWISSKYEPYLELTRLDSGVNVSFHSIDTMPRKKLCMVKCSRYLHNISYLSNTYRDIILDSSTHCSPFYLSGNEGDDTYVLRLSNDDAPLYLRFGRKFFGVNWVIING